MKTQNFKVTAQGPPVPVTTTVKQSDYDKGQVDAKAPVPGRGNQTITTGVKNQNLAENYCIGSDVISLRGQDKATEQQLRTNTSYSKNSKGEFSY